MYQQIRRGYDLANYHYQHSKDKEAELGALIEIERIVKDRISVLKYNIMRTLIIRLKEEKKYNKYTMKISKEFLPDFQKLITKGADEDVFADIKIETDDV